ncbi:aldo/keto reductase [Paenisporosarcina quisquiliarum]|uniref:Aldo/keto reductase n=1 Tax=Paenisporosarcina quisquiliarum TaxID=365346 RepID=A0A9X3RDU2_9BACL|nr:aldo/keto reductase [Paenisporosarcina quisquiliarum]MCZ8538140.1 aldo/keto reductase [Paenisporosarcina quisquiliarum]
MENMKMKRSLGHTDLQLSPLGLGTWQFSKGSGVVGKFWGALDDQLTEDIIKTSLKGGINWFDTAEVYGNGESERILAKALENIGVTPEEARIATKWWPMLRTAGSISKTIDERKEALRHRPIDLYQIHQPYSLSSVEKQMKATIELVKAGHINHIGVSNFNASAMVNSHRILTENGLSLASNQVKYSLLDRRMEENGVLESAKELGISIIAYSPLEQGLLSGKFHDNPALIHDAKGPRRFQRKFKEAGLAESKPLIALLDAIGEKYNVSASQVALNWTIHYHGETVFAIPGATKVHHAQDNVGAMTFKLDAGELEEISRASWKILQT